MCCHHPFLPSQIIYSSKQIHPYEGAVIIVAHIDVAKQIIHKPLNQTLMAIDVEKIIPLFVDVSGKGVLGDLVLEYATLKQKLDEPENQTWYFRKANGFA